MVDNISRSFKDISLSFVPHPITKDLGILKNEDAIKRSVRNLVQTNLTEVPFNSTIGSGVLRSLFEFVDYGTASSVQAEVLSVINNHEPRVNKVKVNVFPDPDNNAFSITVYYDIIGQQFPSQTFTFILEATR